MSITVAEKTHWKERIAQKIERAIKELVANHDTLYLENALQSFAPTFSGTDFECQTRVSQR